MTARRSLPSTSSPSAPRTGRQTTARLERTRQRRAKAQQGRQIVRRYSALAGAAALLPATAFDQAVVGGLLAKLLYDLCETYETNLADHKVKAITAVVLGGAHSEWITRFFAEYGGRISPAVGLSTRLVARPMVAAAITYGIGMLFLHHFEKGAWLRTDVKALAHVKASIPQQ